MFNRNDTRMPVRPLLLPQPLLLEWNFICYYYHSRSGSTVELVTCRKNSRRIPRAISCLCREVLLDWQMVDDGAGSDVGCAVLIIRAGNHQNLQLFQKLWYGHSPRNLSQTRKMWRMRIKTFSKPKLYLSLIGRNIERKYGSPKAAI